MDLKGYLNSLKLEVNNFRLIENAFVHASYANENDRFEENNERLEFMGDAVLQILVSEYLFNNDTYLNEGDMTLYRAKLVREEALASYSRAMGLNAYLLLGSGEERTGGRNRDSIVADLFEAFLGAVYLDSGLDIARKVVLNVLPKTLDEVDVDSITDYKTKLQEFVQSDRRENVSYEVVNVTGPPNAPMFEVVVKLNELNFGRGFGTSKKRAEQMAAKDAFEKLVK